jgi:predicted DNA repair protein MutK
MKMAGSSLLALLDDIATVLDDITIMTKVAAKKTAGVLGDDLALNAQQVSGVRAERELPIVWAVAKGSFKNKLILVPAALAISAIIPQLITPLLILGGLFLCFEGAEKIWHHIAHKEARQQHKAELHHALITPDTDLENFEQDKIKGAIRTDFILSAEIIVISLGTTANASFAQQAIVVSLIAMVMTIGVYGLVALIVKLDDIGLHLLSDKRASAVAKLKRTIGSALLSFCPRLMKGLSLVGTAAMFLVGGGIITHGIPFVHHQLETLITLLSYPSITTLSYHLVIGLVAGSICLASFNLIQKFKGQEH